MDWGIRTGITYNTPPSVAEATFGGTQSAFSRTQLASSRTQSAQKWLFCKPFFVGFLT
ncbi:MAG: hypothetical protein WC650_05840 [Candidatus Doudnabacteria bacterium]